MRPWKVLLLVLGLLIATSGLGLVTGGGGLLVAHAAARDDAGYFSSPAVSIRSDAHAVTSEILHFGGNIDDAGWSPARLGRLRVRVNSRTEAPVFVGIAPADKVDRYLEGTSRDLLQDVRGRVARFDQIEGDVAPPAPGDQDFWTVSSVGSGTRTLNWEIETGDWTIVVMNADGSPGLDVRVVGAVRTNWLLAIGVVLLLGGLLGLALGAGMIVVSVREAMPPPAAGAPQHLPRQDVPAAMAPQDGYPLHVSGHLDLSLSRWLWLVKWFLVIPHVIVLSFLWLIAIFLTLVAAVAILVTGRYPRGIFDFNVGVLRWTWRVTFYAFTLGTDRYPPFSLGAEPGYPASLTIPYPERLSRPLVLVKWIVALPHLIVVALFGGGIALDWVWLTNNGDAPQTTIGGGIIALLVLIAAVALAFTGQYPQALFDLVMGMERWTFRVFAYVGLMTDEYPPFRFDMGGTDPGELPHFPPSPTATVDADTQLLE